MAARVAFEFFQSNFGGYVAQRRTAARSAVGEYVVRTAPGGPPFSSPNLAFSLRNCTKGRACLKLGLVHLVVLYERQGVTRMGILPPTSRNEVNAHHAARFALWGSALRPRIDQNSPSPRHYNRQRAKSRLTRCGSRSCRGGRKSRSEGVPRLYVTGAATRCR